MKATTLAAIGITTIALVPALANITGGVPAARADVDTDFANQLHTFGIYGQKDYNAWLGKIVCERLHKGVDANAVKSAEFVSHNLEDGTTQVQTWQFVGTAIQTYCPDLVPVLQQVSAGRPMPIQAATWRRLV